MSRSAKHTPWRRLQATAPGFVPVHDHRFGPCDISSDPPSNKEARCHWKEAPKPADVLAPTPATSPARQRRHHVKSQDHDLTRSLAIGLDPDELDEID
jgi:hypothetical protein